MTYDSCTDSELETIDFSVVIPTRNNHRELKRCLVSIQEQSKPAKEVIIIYDGELSEDRKSQCHNILSDETTLTITESESGKIPGSGTARNTGMNIAGGSVVVFLDDDTVLAPSYLSRLHLLYQSHDSPRLAGIGGLLYGSVRKPQMDPHWLGRIFDRLFYQETELWQINKAGFSTRSYRIDESPETIIKADWLGGSNMSFKRGIITKFRFPQWSSGREPGEDLMVGW